MHPSSGSIKNPGSTSATLDIIKLQVAYCIKSFEAFRNLNLPNFMLVNVNSTFGNISALPPALDVKLVCVAKLGRPAKVHFGKS